MKRPEDMEREELEEEVAYLRSELGITDDATSIAALRDTYGLPPAASRVLMSLYLARGRVLSKDQISDSLPVVTRDTWSERKLADVYVCRIRAKIGHAAIKTAWGAGYYLTPEGIAKVDAALAERKAA